MAAVRCPVCQAENPPGAKFCMECGTRLKRACPGCGHDLPGGARFCPECGRAAASDVGGAGPERGQPQAGGAGPGPAAPAAEPRAYTPAHLAAKILNLRGAVEGERKQVTVLFADIRESMNLAEQLDPEQWHAILDGFFRILSGAVHRFEGTVNQYTGDGIMALFGAPIAHEDHAQRACHAALQMKAELAGYADELRRTRGLNFSARIGLNSGEVVVGAIGDDLRMDYTAQGHTVGLAARMEQLAAPGSVYLPAATAHLVEGYFELRSLGPFDIKGVRDPVEVFELVGYGQARTRLDVAMARGLTRFVGRKRELAALEDALAQAAAGKRRIAGVFGEAGAGKSRLCYEFIERARRRGVVVHQSTCVAHGRMIPFLPVLGLLRSYFGIKEDDDPRTARAKIAGRLLMIDAEVFKPRLPFIFDFLDVADPAEPPFPDIEPEVRQEMLYQGWKRSMEAEAGGDPEILFVEDLHWIDGASDTFLGRLTGLLEGTRTLLLVNSRPGYRADWMDDPAYRQIDLEPLGGAELDEMLDELIGTDPSTRDLRARIAERTAGNPFFVEEVVRSLADQGMLVGSPGAYRAVADDSKLLVPPTVQAVLAARIDRLADSDKRVLETAAVLGKTFRRSLLEAATGMDAGALEPILQRLEGGGFIEQIASYPDVEYLFRHPLTREVAYQTQLAARRATVHRQVAEAIEAECCGKSDENAALLAHHWAAAGETLRAIQWSHRAAKWASTRDQAEAYRHWQSILELLGDCPECNESLGLGIEARVAMLETGWRLAAPREEQQRLFEEARALAERSGDRAMTARVLAAFSMGESFSGHVGEALDLLEEASRLATESDDPALKLQLAARLSYARLVTGNVAEAAERMSRAIELAEALPEEALARAPFDPRVWLYGMRALPAAYLGDLGEARRYLERGFEVARDRDDVASLVTMHGIAVTLARFRGDPADAMDHAREQLRLAEGRGSPTLVCGAADSMGMAEAMSGRWQQALLHCRRAVETARANATLLQSEGIMLSNLAAVHLGGGDPSRAAELAREAVEICRQRHTRMFECRARIVLARALLRSGAEHDAVADLLAETEAIVASTGARLYEPFLCEEWAELERARGNMEESVEQMKRALRLFEEVGAEGHASRFREALETGEAVRATA